jgi:hypothetical protein
MAAPWSLSLLCEGTTYRHEKKSRMSTRAESGATRGGSALRLRRTAIIAAPILAAALIVVGFFTDPDIGASGRKLAREYAENPGWIQISALSFHFAYALLIIPAFALAASVCGRGAWLANVALLFAVLGLTTLPGLLVTDFYDVAIYGKLGGDAWQTVNDRLGELPGTIVFLLSTIVSATLALPTALFALFRAGRLPWWPAPAFLVAEVAARAVPGGIGLLVLAAALVVLGLWLPRALPAEA